MLVEKNVPLQACNTFHIVARAHTLVRLRSLLDLQALLANPDWAETPKFVLGGGSNIDVCSAKKSLPHTAMRGIALVLLLGVLGVEYAAWECRDWRGVAQAEITTTLSTNGYRYYISF
jgi:hypothetical protein